MAESTARTPKRIITEADVERISQSAPDYIQEASDTVKDLYVAAEWAREERDLSPYRYFDLTINEGQETERQIHIDYQQTLNPGAVVKEAGGTLEQVRLANAHRLPYLNLDRAYGRAVILLNKEMGVATHRPRNIVDYTGTILELFGKFYTITDVHKVMLKEYRIKIPENELKKFYVENRDSITKRRAAYVLDSKDFRVATESGRLEVLNQLLIDAELKNRTAGGTDPEMSVLILKILEQARKEVKGNELKMTVDGSIDINATLHAENNVKEVMGQMSINALVVGLTAAKSGLNPSVLIAQLANSWYAKFNGFNGNVMDGEEVLLPSALIKTYDWGRMEQESTKFVQEFQHPIAEVVEEQNAEVATAGEERRMELLRRLKSSRSARAKEIARANPNVEADSFGMQDNPLKPVDAPEEPRAEFEIDYNLSSRRGGVRQKRGMRVKGAIGESISRHAAIREGKVEVSESIATPEELGATARRMIRGGCRLPKPKKKPTPSTRRDNGSDKRRK